MSIEVVNKGYLLFFFLVAKYDYWFIDKVFNAVRCIAYKFNVITFCKLY